MGNKLLLAVVFGFALCFAQESPEKLAVYVSGASDASINKSLGNKLLFAMSQSGKYAEIADPGSFQDELAKGGKSDIVTITQTAKRYGAGYVCIVSMIEAFGAHSISARLIRISDSQVLKTGTVDHSLKSLDDLTAVSNGLAQQLLAPKNAVAPTKQCTKKYNVNELVFKIREGFPNNIKNCSSELAKDTVITTPSMVQCTVDGIKKELPEGFPNTDKIVVGLTSFVQEFLNTTVEGGVLDSSKLVSATTNVNMGEFLSHVKKLAADECVVDKPYEPNVALAEDKGSPSDNSERRKAENARSFGIRTGINFSHTYAETPTKKGNYGSIAGVQAGFITDFAINNWFHIQPGLMYIQKGMDDSSGAITTHYITAHHLELPLLLSAKLSAFRLNVGPYLGLCMDSYRNVFKDVNFDVGLSTGIGFDIKKFFYIGLFYDRGFTNTSNISGYKFYNRTLGFNTGINL